MWEKSGRRCKSTWLGIREAVYKLAQAAGSRGGDIGWIGEWIPLWNTHINGIHEAVFEVTLALSSRGGVLG